MPAANPFGLPLFAEARTCARGDLELAQQLAGAARGALERSRLFEAERTARSLSQQLAHTGSLLATELDPAAVEWAAEHDGAAVIWHEVWDGRPDQLAAQIDEDFDHASWSENFPWTRLPGIEMPSERKPPLVRPRGAGPRVWREALGDGSFGGPYQLPDKDLLRVWAAAVEQLRERLCGLDEQRA